MARIQVPQALADHAHSMESGRSNPLLPSLASFTRDSHASTDIASQEAQPKKKRGRPPKKAITTIAMPSQTQLASASLESGDTKLKVDQSGGEAPDSPTVDSATKRVKIDSNGDVAATTDSSTEIKIDARASTETNILTMRHLLSIFSTDSTPATVGNSARLDLNSKPCRQAICLLVDFLDQTLRGIPSILNWGNKPPGEWSSVVTCTFWLLHVHSLRLTADDEPAALVMACAFLAGKHHDLCIKYEHILGACKGGLFEKHFRRSDNRCMPTNEAMCRYERTVLNTINFDLSRCPLPLKALDSLKSR